MYKTTLLAYRITKWDWKSARKFSRIWRKKMDNMFDLQAQSYKQELIESMILEEERKHGNDRRAYHRTPQRPRSRSHRRNRSESRSETSVDPVARLLLNYDREVVAMIREVNKEFNNYLDYPHRYPFIHTEKKKFFERELAADESDEVMDIDVDLNDEAFKRYWRSRAGILCDKKVKEEKNLLRTKWRFAVRNHLRLSRNPRVEELRCLLESEDEDDSDVEVLEEHRSIVYVSSDED
jgi:hypothetical protein